MEQPVKSLINIQKVRAHLQHYSLEVHPIVLGRSKEKAPELASIYNMLLSLNASMSEDLEALEQHLSVPENQGIRFTRDKKAGLRNTSIGSRVLDEKLSCREIEVLHLFARGCSYNEVAEIFDCATATVQTYVKRIYRKLKVHSRSEAIFEATSLGILNVKA